MTMDTKKLFNIAKSYSEFLKDNYEENFFRMDRIANILKSDDMVRVYKQMIPNKIDLVKFVYITYFLLRGYYKVEEIIKMVNNIYVVEIEYYEDQAYIHVQCDSCYGSGEVECNNCDGDGEVDCRSCDGDGQHDCYYCNDGKVECSSCDGDGNQTEEDDEGEEIEVECSSCEGSGQEDCRECSGMGNFECHSCDGKGTETCQYCSGNGNEYCDECGGNGDVESSEQYYMVTLKRIAVIGNKVKEIENKTMTIDEYNEYEYEDSNMDYDFTLRSRVYTSDDTVDDERYSNEMDEDFVVIHGVYKLEGMDPSVISNV
jgi:hypothetical protein